jgi:tetratricopeptide (TPR) repeat protein
MIAYERLLINLHVAMTGGDEVEADRLREESEPFFRILDELELTVVNGLSGDLYMLSNEELFESPEMPTDILKYSLDAAIDDESPLEILHILRQKPFVVQSDLAHCRSRAYSLLGLYNLALVFVRYAINLEPHNEYYRYTYLNTLFLVGQYADGVEAARRCLSEMPTVGPELRVMIARAIYQDMIARRDDLNGYDRTTMSELTTILESLTLQGTQSQLLSRRLLATACGISNQCYSLLGDITNALKSVNTYLDQYPKDADMLALRGLLMLSFGQDSGAGGADIERAVKSNTTNAAAYIVAGLACVRKGEAESDIRAFGEAAKYFEKAARLAPNNYLKAVALEQVAICYAEMGKSKDKVRKTLDAALSLGFQLASVRATRMRLEASWATGQELRLNVINSRIENAYAAAFMQQIQYLPPLLSSGRNAPYAAV